MDITWDVVVVMVPLPAQGHLNQLLNLSRLLSARGVPVHYVGSASHNRQAKLRVHGWKPCALCSIHFHDFHLPSILSPSPDPLALNKFPAHFQYSFEATAHIREPLGALLKALSTTARRVVVVHDSVMSFAAKEACSIPNGEAYAFHTVSALASLFYYWEALGRPTNNGDMIIPAELPYLSLEDCFTQKFSDFIKDQYEYMKYVAGDIYNTCRPIEGRFIDLLSQEKVLGDKNKWAIGPLNPVSIKSSPQQRHDCLDWLDKHPKNSVLYVSFGTMTSLSDQQITELAIGLEYSEQRFIWVVREADKADIFAQEKQDRRIKLPEGFQERVRGAGMIVTDWAPQLEILAHPSTGGFLSHCGWNSCMESFSMGVPIAAWPMHSDQPRNTMLVTEVLKVGLVVREWARRKELVSSLEIEFAVKKLMTSIKGEGMRRRAEGLGAAVREAMAQGGSSSQQLDSFINHISR